MRLAKLLGLGFRVPCLAAEQVWEICIDVHMFQVQRFHNVGGFHLYSRSNPKKNAYDIDTNKFFVFGSGVPPFLNGNSKKSSYGGALYKDGIGLVWATPMFASLPAVADHTGIGGCRDRSGFSES